MLWLKSGDRGALEVSYAMEILSRNSSSVDVGLDVRRSQRIWQHDNIGA